jgi:peptidyl-prolyl cis-trans isomerase B (cyclophilin B)
MLKSFFLIAICSFVFSTSLNAQKRSTTSESKKPDSSQTTKKTNARPAAPKIATEPFEKATVAKMAEQSPETVRNFLNLVAIGAYDTTTFSRVVPGFIVQGGNLSTREKTTPELDKRSQRTIADEPNAVKHERGIVSMARSGEPNSASTHFFILVGDARHLDGTFAAFGRVTSGMEIVDSINKMPVEGDKPEKPVLLKRSTVSPCSS